MTAICAHRPTVSTHNRVSGDSPDISEPTQSETKAPLEYGRLPEADCAPRYQNRVMTTRKIMNRISHAPRVCDPKKREERPLSAGLLRTRSRAKITMPTRTRTPNRSSRKPTMGHVPTMGTPKSATNSAP